MAKTYPSPSEKYIETSCIAGINEDGAMRRLYPVPFRLIYESHKFKKWQWIEARIEKRSQDHRKESFKIFTDTLKLKHIVTPQNGTWNTRRTWINKLPAYSSIDEIPPGQSLTLIKPKQMISLEIEKELNPDWEEAERNKLLRIEQQHGGLFTNDQRLEAFKILRKLPFKFYYKYLTYDNDNISKHKIVDWEAGALFWKCYDNDQERWEALFRNKFEQEMASKDLMFLVGNMHRFKNQWLIISIIYPPKQTTDSPRQKTLFDL